MKRYHSQAGINYLESWPGKDQTHHAGQDGRNFKNNFVFSTSSTYSDDGNDDGHILSKT